MAKNSDRVREFNRAVLEEIASTHRAKLRQLNAKEPVESADLREWAATAARAYAQRPRAAKLSEREAFATAYSSAAALREIRAVQSDDSPATQQLVYRVLFICGDRPDVLEDIFHGRGIRTRRRNARESRSREFYARLQDDKLIARAERIRAQDPFSEMTRWASPVALRAIKGLTEAGWNTLTAPNPRRRTEGAEKWVARKFAEVLRALDRLQQDGDGAETEPLDSMQAHVLWRRMKPMAAYVGSLRRLPPTGGSCGMRRA